jgi:hypothetical protein
MAAKTNDDETHLDYITVQDRKIFANEARILRKVTFSLPIVSGKNLFDLCIPGRCDMPDPQIRKMALQLSLGERAVQAAVGCWTAARRSMKKSECPGDLFLNYEESRWAR